MFLPDPYQFLGVLMRLKHSGLVSAFSGVRDPSSVGMTLNFTNFSFPPRNSTYFMILWMMHHCIIIFHSKATVEDQ